MIDNLPDGDEENDQFKITAACILGGLLAGLSLIIGTAVWSWLS